MKKHVSISKPKKTHKQDWVGILATKLNHLLYIQQLIGIVSTRPAWAVWDQEAPVSLKLPVTSKAAELTCNS